MGTTAVANMKIISNRVNELSEVRPLFSDVCKDSDGNPIPASYMHTVAVLNIIKKRAEVATSPPSATTLTPKATSRVSNKAHSAKESESREKRKENSKDTTSSKVFLTSYKCLSQESKHSIDSRRPHCSGCKHSTSIQLPWQCCHIT